MIELMLALNLLSVEFALWSAWRIQTTHAYPGRWKYALIAALSGLPCVAWVFYIMVLR